MSVPPPAPADLEDQAAWYAWYEQALADNPRRLAHITTVWRRGLSYAAFADEPERFALTCLLHDVGRGLDPADQAPHALVGARFLRDLGLPGPLVALVAQHTGARYEAALRGFPELETEFPYTPSGDLDMLTYIDGTTGPDGAVLDAQARLADIAVRYGEDAWQVAAFRPIFDEIERGYDRCYPLVVPSIWQV